MNSADIILPNPDPENNVHTKLDELHKFSSAEILTWCSHMFVQETFYFYLFRKYKQNCIANSQIGTHLELKPTVEKNDNYVNTHMIKSICHCITNNVDILLIPVYISNDDGTDAHANLLIYRKKKSTIELFEPHGQYLGSTEEEHHLFDKAYESIISRII